MKPSPIRHPKEFLRVVAEHYFASMPLDPVTGHPDVRVMSDYLFVFPNRRSGLFFCQHLQELRPHQPMLAPQVTTIAELFGHFSTLRVADHTELLFLLYNIYNEVASRYAREHHLEFNKEDFSNFVHWGDLLLSDFDDIDRYLANARQIFSNVSDLKDIDQHFGGLDEEVIKVLEKFWRNVRVEQFSDAKDKFVHTWSILHEVYESLRSELRARGLAYEGMRQREVVEHLDDEALFAGSSHDAASVLPRHIVFVGITAIDKAERILFRWLKREGRAEFCWDYADPHLQSVPEGGRHQEENPAHAAYFTKENLQDFPNVLTNEELRSSCFAPEDAARRKFSCIPMPTSVGQTGRAAQVLKRWQAEDPLHTAVVLADENLLIPMLYAVPPSYGTYNVTMGYSLKSTPVCSLVDALVSLQHNQHNGHFYYSDVLAVLSNTLVQQLEPDLSVSLRRDINEQSLYLVPVSQLSSSDLLKALFLPVSTLAEAATYLERLFLRIGTLLKAGNIEPLQREALVAYLDLQRQLLRQIADAGMSGLTHLEFFGLLQRLARSHRVSYSGEPLSGLQVMGVLETRSLDFSRLVILSANEGILPAKPSQNSFIPNSLRQAFGLPTQRHRDSVMAYHFYRMISRASEVVFLYDTRANLQQTGEPSRYLLQLQYLDGIRFEVETDVPQEFSTGATGGFSVPKTPRVMRALQQYYAPSGTRSLSATSLKSFVSCPLKFYFSYIEQLRSDEDLEAEMDSRQFGDLLHSTMKILYENYKGSTLDVAFYDRLLEDPYPVRAAIGKAVADHAGQHITPGYMELISELVQQYVEAFLRYDRSLAPILYLDSECNVNVPFAIEPGVEVNLTAFFDRLDRRGDALRVVDYKTGYPGEKDKKLQVPGLRSLFEAEGGGSEEAFQVMFYCAMLNHANPETMRRLRLTPDMLSSLGLKQEMHLYFSRSLSKGLEEASTILQYKPVKDSDEPFGEGPMLDYRLYATIFEQGLRDILSHLFDPSEPFHQAAQGAHVCKNCDFRQICGR